MIENNRTNCPNCGAPIDQHSEKCAYCDTPYVGSIKAETLPDIGTIQDIVCKNRREAEDICNCMREILDMYGCVTVADLYDLIGKPSSYSSNKYGWVDLTLLHYCDDPLNMTVTLKFPRPIPLK